MGIGLTEGILPVRPRPLWQRHLGLTLALLWLLGTALAWQRPRPWEAWAVWVTAGLLLHLLLPNLGKALARAPRLLAVVAFLRVALLVMGLAGLRVAWTQARLRQPTPLMRLAREQAQVRLVGWVATAPRWKDDMLYVDLAVEQVHAPPLAPPQPARGRVRLRWPRSRAPNLAYGDRISVYGRLAPLPTPRGGFDYRTYLARQGVVARMDPWRTGRIGVVPWRYPLRLLFALREHGRKTVEALWPQPEAGFFAGILLGLDDLIAEPLYRAFRDTGTAHILVISGFNITIVAGLALRLLRRRFSPRKAAVGTVLAVAAYTLLVGADPAVVRAAWMATLALLARHLGRRQHGLTTLAVTAALMVLFSPAVLWDVSFQLSFAATLGLLLFAQPLVDGFVALARRVLPPPWPERLAGPVGEFFLLTVAAQLLTLPVVVFHFGRLSLISWVANPLVLPVQSPLMVLGGIALLLGMVWFPLGRPVAWLAWPMAAYSIRVAEGLARVPAATITVPAWAFLLPYLLALLAWLLWRAGRGKAVVLSRAGVVLAGWALAVVLGRPVARLQDARLHVWLWPTERSLALLVQRGATWVWLNAGEQGAETLSLLDRLQPWPWPVRQVWVVASGRTQNVAGYLAFLERARPQAVLWMPQGPGPAGLRRLRRALQQANVPVYTPTQAALLETGDLRLEAVPQPPLAARLRLQYGAFTLALHPTGPEGLRQDAVLVVVLAPTGAESGPPSQPALYYLGQPLPLAGQGYHLATDGQQMWLFRFGP